MRSIGAPGIIRYNATSAVDDAPSGSRPSLGRCQPEGPNHDGLSFDSSDRGSPDRRGGPRFRWRDWDSPPPPCPAVTTGAVGGAARGATRGVVIGAISGNAGRGAAIGAAVGGIGGAARRATARANGACY